MSGILISIVDQPIDRSQKMGNLKLNYASVASERQSMEKKKKELEKLRKTVVKKECEGGEDGEEVRDDLRTIH